MNIGDSIY